MKRTLSLVATLVLTTLPLLLIALLFGLKSLLGGMFFATYLSLLIGGAVLLFAVVLPALRWLDSVKARGLLPVIGIIAGVVVLLGAFLTWRLHGNPLYGFGIALGATALGAFLYRTFDRKLAGRKQPA